MELKICISCKRKQALINYKKERNICNLCWSKGIKKVEDKVETKKDKIYKQKLDNSLSKFIPKDNYLLNSDIANLPGIYKLTNTKLNKVYIGQSSNLRSRCDNYKTLTGYINPILRKDLELYKSKHFRFEVLEYMPESSSDDRLEKEAYYKGQFQPYELYNFIIGKEDTAGYERYKESLKTKELIV